MVAHPEGQAVIPHQHVRQFLRGGPVAVEFLQRAIPVDHQRLQHAVPALQHGDGGIHHCSVLRHVLGIGHAGRDVVGLQDRPHGQRQRRGRLAARVVEQTRIAFLRHRARHIGIAAAFLQQDPWARLGILRQHVLDEIAGMQGDGGHDGCHLHRLVHGGDLRRVIGVLHQGAKAQVVGHALAVQRPARAIEHGRAHRGPVYPDIGLADAFGIALQAGGMAQQVMAVAVGLGGHAVGVVGHDGVHVLARQLDQGAGGLVQLRAERQQLVAQHGRAEGRMHVLAGAAGMQQGDVLARGLDQQRLEGDDRIRALGAGSVARVQHLLQAGGQARRHGLVEQALIRIDHRGGLVDFPQPEELVTGRCIRGLRGNGHAQEQDGCGVAPQAMQGLSHAVLVVGWGAKNSSPGSLTCRWQDCDHA